MKEKWQIVLLSLFLLADLTYSFIQYNHLPLDGDLAAIVLPAENYAQVLRDPFGLSALLEGERYGGVNRYFIHASLSLYFKNLPLFLQHFVSPVDSIYLACALAKTAMQAFLIAVLAAFASGTLRFWRKNFLVAATLITPLFQTFGYNVTMGIIGKSITYTFFYALPACGLLLFFLPFYRRYVLGKVEKWTLPVHFVLAALALVLPLSGPLVPAVILLVCPAVLVVCLVPNVLPNPSSAAPANSRTGVRQYVGKIPGELLFYFGFASLMSLYSLYLGRFNIENPTETLSLGQRYAALVSGIAQIFTLKLGLPLLLFATLGNAWLLFKFRENPTARRVLIALSWLGIFSVAYLLLLPLGGYRSYRPFIVRHDTILPVTLCLAGGYAISACLLLRIFEGKKRRFYSLGLLAFCLIFTLADEPDFDKNACEKAALVTLSRSDEKVVRLENACTVMSWHRRTEASESVVIARLLKEWKVTEEVRLFYQRRPAPAALF